MRAAYPVHPELFRLLQTDWGSLDKIDYFLEHEDERREIQMAGHHRCLTDHSYSNRVREVVRILEKDGALNGKSKSREQLQTRDDRDTRIQGVD